MDTKIFLPKRTRKDSYLRGFASVNIEPGLSLRCLLIRLDPTTNQLVVEFPTTIWRDGSRHHIISPSRPIREAIRTEVLTAYNALILSRLQPIPCPAVAPAEVDLLDAKDATEDARHDRWIDDLDAELGTPVDPAHDELPF